MKNNLSEALPTLAHSIENLFFVNPLMFEHQNLQKMPFQPSVFANFERNQLSFLQKTVVKTFNLTLLKLSAKIKTYGGAISTTKKQRLSSVQQVSARRRQVNGDKHMVLSLVCEKKSVTFLINRASMSIFCCIFVCRNNNANISVLENN